jgi:hypothetical protein
MLPPEVNQFQAISFVTATTGTVRSLARALLTRQTPPALPDPLPDPPALPTSYGDDFRRRLIARIMPVDDQIQLAALLKVHCADPAHGEEARTLLAELRARSDVALVVAHDIDQFLSPPPPPPPTRTPAAEPMPNPDPAPAQTAEREPTTGKFENWLMEQLSAITCSRLYLAPEIPPNKLTNACTITNTPPERGLALIDCTVFGSAKNCLLFTPMEAVQHHSEHRLKDFRLPYLELEADYSPGKGYSVVDSKGVQVFHLSGTGSETHVPVAKLLNDIHAHLSRAS